MTTGERITPRAKAAMSKTWAKRGDAAEKVRIMVFLFQ